MRMQNLLSFVLRYLKEELAAMKAGQSKNGAFCQKRLEYFEKVNIGIQNQVVQQVATKE